MSIFNTASKLKDLKDTKKDLEAQIKDLNVEIAEQEQELVDYMMEEETNNFNHAGFTFYMKNVLQASPVADRKDELYQTLKSEGYGDLVKETVNAQTLKAFVKEQMEENDDELPNWMNGLINTFEKPGIGIRKGSK